ncbi:MAG: glycosyltransferase [Aestuariivirga sp.]
MMPMLAAATQLANRRRRTAFVINSLAGGGAERVMCTLLRASEAERAEYDISLILLDEEEAAYKVPEWVEVVQLNCRRSLLRSLLSLIVTYRRSRPDITISFLTRANVVNAVAASLLRIPAIISERVNTSSHLGQGASAVLAKLLVKWSYPKARKIIAVSSGVAEHLRTSFGIPEQKLSVISNPIDTDEIHFQASQEALTVLDEPYVMAMGRLVPNKNFGMLIEAFAQSGLSGKLLILGEGPERKTLQKRAVALGLSDRVVMPGFAENPYPALRAAAFFVLPSNAEGFPNSLLEAMSVGVPVISTNCLSGPAEILAGVPREQVASGVCFAEYGILVTPDEPGAMADALRAMLEPKRRWCYREKAVRRAADFSVSRAKDAYWTIIRAHLPALDVIA